MMNDFFQQVFSLLTTPAGSLAYHLVLAFSIVGALQAAIGQARQADTSQSRRTITGLSLLLLLQIALFMAAALVWQDLIYGDIFLPAFDRGISLLSVVVIVWLWAFPQPSRLADGATILLGLFAITITTFASLYWFQVAYGLPYNGSYPDAVTSLVATIFLSIGVLILLIRRPENWGSGLAMLVILLTGYIYNLVFPPPNGDYSGALRLAQMAAYPLLIALPTRLASSAPKPTTTIQIIHEEPSALLSEEQRAVLENRPSYTDPKVIQSLLTLASERDVDRICCEIAASICRIMQSDLCLLVIPSGKSERILVQCGYDLIREQNLSSFEMDSQFLPVLTAALKLGRVRRIPTGSTSPDLVALVKSLNLERSGNLLVVPVLSSLGDLVMGIILLSPYSERDWSQGDQFYLTILAKLMVQFLQHSQEIAYLQDELANFKQEMKLVGAQTGVNLMAADEKNALVSSDAKDQELEQLRGELRLVLEEIAFLRLEAEPINRLKSSVPTGEAGIDSSALDLDKMQSIIEDLSKSLSAIESSSNKLMADSNGAFNEDQRRNIERLTLTAERMSKLINELTQITLTAKWKLPVEMQEVDLQSVINETIWKNSKQILNKGIELQVDIPSQLPIFRSEPNILEEILDCLIQNAGLVTPDGGEVLLRARKESKEDFVDYILVQVIDQGGGIRQEDLSLIFTTHPEPVPGVANREVDLRKAKANVEALSGRIWVDSEPGKGAIFNFLLPVDSEDGI